MLDRLEDDPGDPFDRHGGEHPLPDLADEHLFQHGAVSGFQVGVDLAGGLVDDRGAGQSRLDQDHVDPVHHQLAPQGVGEALHRVLGGRVGPHERIGDPPAQGAQVDDATPGMRRSWPGAEEGQKQLSDLQQPEHVDFQLLPHLIHGQVLQRSDAGDAGVVDQCRQVVVSQGLPYLCRRCLDRRPVRDVEAQGREAPSQLAAQPAGVFRPAHAAEHAVPPVQKRFGGGVPDSRGHAGDHDVVQPHYRPPGRS